MHSLSSVWRGIRIMHRPIPGLLQRWHIRRLHGARQRFWLHYWTPAWHEGRGPYFNIALGVIQIARGY